MMRISFTHSEKIGIVRHTPRPWLVAPDGSTYAVPSTVPLFAEPNDNAGIANPILVTDQIWEYVKAINSADGYNYARSVGNMLDNRGDGRVVAIACGGNFITWDMETESYVRVVSRAVADPTANLNPAIDNWHYHPDKFWKACAVDGYGKITNVGEALDFYWPLIHGNSRLWLAKADLERFPPLPMNMTYKLRGTEVYGVADGQIIPLMTKGHAFHNAWWRIGTLGVIEPTQ